MSDVNEDGGRGDVSDAGDHHAWMAIARRATGWLLALTALAGGQARAQSAGAQTEAVTIAGSLDVPSVFVFRGIVQERDPRLTLTPAAEVVVAVGRGATAGVGVWHSLHGGSSGSDGPTGRWHYREDFHASFGLPLGGGLTLGARYAAYTSPNVLFETIQELSVSLTSATRYRPHVLVAFELSGAADQIDRGTGTYLELGVGPRYRLGTRTTVSVPVRIGLSLNRYYEDFTRDPTFGFVSGGGLVAVTLGRERRRGTWDVHGGVDVYGLGDTTRGFNADDRGVTRASRIVGRVGMGVRY